MIKFVGTANPITNFKFAKEYAKNSTLWAMANDPKLNIGNNIGMRETQFFHMFVQKTV